MHWDVGRPAHRSLRTAHLLLTHPNRMSMILVIGSKMNIRAVCEIVIAVAIPFISIVFGVMLALAVL